MQIEANQKLRILFKGETDNVILRGFDTDFN